jgi:hypothetical protein
MESTGELELDVDKHAGHSTLHPHMLRSSLQDDEGEDSSEEEEEEEEAKGGEGGKGEGETKFQNKSMDRCSAGEAMLRTSDYGGVLRSSDYIVGAGKDVPENERDSLGASLDLSTSGGAFRGRLGSFSMSYDKDGVAQETEEERAAMMSANDDALALVSGQIIIDDRMQARAREQGDAEDEKAARVSGDILEEGQPHKAATAATKTSQSVDL